MATTIQISEELRRELKMLASSRDLSYEEMLEDLLDVFETAVPFRTEREFAEWFEDNLGAFGFEEVLEKRKRASPDYRLRDEVGNEVEVELELVGKNFVSHGHDPEAVDQIICLYSDDDEISGVPVLSMVDSDDLKDQVITGKGSFDHTSVTIPKTLRDDIEELIDDTGFNNVSEFAKWVLRDIAAQGSFDAPEEYNETVENVRERLRNLGYIE